LGKEENMVRKMATLALGVLAVLFGSVLIGGAAMPPTVIRVGINAPLTGDIPKVGEGTKYAAQLWLEDIKKAGGLQVGDKKYPVELVIEDNEAKAESAVAANTKMITQDRVLVIVGPQASKQAVPAGEVANNYETPMISPWSTNPNTTLNRPWVFRACFLDPFQGPVIANFVTDHFKFTKAAVLYDVGSDYPKGLAEFFKKAWEALHGAGSVVAYESFTTKDKDFSAQLTKIKDALGIVQTGIQKCGKLTGDIKVDRKCVRDAIASVRDFKGITGNMTFHEGSGDPSKCAVVVKISDTGEFTFFQQVCPK
jgi:branched-chain amino acid transport system substrate-binding protein